MATAKSQFSVWEGVYESFDAIKPQPFVFNEELWLEKQKQQLTTALQTDATESRDYPFVPISALLLSQLQQLSILDFGGGLATNFLALQTSLPDISHLKYHIVETARLCDYGREKLASYPQLYFHTDIPECAIDVVHLASTLHYIEYWQELLTTLCRKRPKYIILADLLAGDIPTFVSTQNFHGTLIPVWFWNIRDIISYLAQHRYQVIYHALYQQSICGQERLPNHRLPPSHQLTHTCNLIFHDQGDFYV